MQNPTRWMLVVSLLTLAVGALPASAQSAFGWVEGQWRWEDNEAGCDSAYDIRVTRGDKYIIFGYTYQGKRDSAEYRVLAFGPGVVRARIEGEKRLDDAGNPVVWDFVQLSEDAFCWHQADWPDTGCTRALYRCTVVVPGRDARAPDARGAARPVPARLHPLIHGAFRRRQSLADRPGSETVEPGSA